MHRPTVLALALWSGGCSFGLETLGDADPFDKPALDSGEATGDDGGDDGGPTDTGEPCVDADGDGFDTCSDDCDDTDSRTYPGAADLDSATLCMTDADGDGWGDDAPATGVEPGLDCDDTDETLNADDTDGDGFDTCDDDCHDLDEDTFPGAAFDESATACMTDADGDGWGSTTPAGDAESGTDCDDADSSVHPAAPDVPWDGDDQDCSGSDAGSIVTASTSPGLRISDYQTVTSTVTAGSCADVYEVTVSVNITHTFQGDLTLTVRGPSGTQVTLHNRTGGSANNIVGTYSTSGGTLTPAASLGTLVGTLGTGNWTLTASDAASGDTGTLNSWGVELACP